MGDSAYGPEKRSQEFWRNHNLPGPLHGDQKLFGKISWVWVDTCAASPRAVFYPHPVTLRISSLSSRSTFLPCFVRAGQQKKRRWVLFSWPLREGPIILQKKNLYNKKDLSHFMGKEPKEQSSQGLVYLLSKSRYQNKDKSIGTLNGARNCAWKA